MRARQSHLRQAGQRDQDEAVCRRYSLQFRSEEHTSELQSLTNLVCRLLLEKKKTPMVSKNMSLPIPSDSTTQFPTVHVHKGAHPPIPVRAAGGTANLAGPLYSKPRRYVMRRSPTAIRLLLNLPRLVVAAGARALCVHASASLSPTLPLLRLLLSILADLAKRPFFSFFFFFKAAPPPRVFPFSPTRPSPD